MKVKIKPSHRIELPTVHPRLVANMGKQKPLWDLYRDGVTQGFLEAHGACPEKARLLAIEGLAPMRAGGALAFGSIFHEALDRTYTNAMIAGCYPDIDALLWEMEERDRAKLNSNKDADTAILLQDLEMNYGMAEPLLKKYLERWSKDLSMYDWVALEKVFGDWGDGCVWTAPGGHKIRVRGKFDGVFRMNGKLWLFETKTKARIDDVVILDTLSYDLQVNLYLWAIKRVFGETPAGVVYNLVRRPQLEQKKTETLQAFCERIRADLDARSDFYFTRLNATILPREQEAWEGEFNDMMMQVVRWYDGEFHYRRRSSCGSPWQCQYLPICGRGDRSRYARKEDVYPELVPGAEVE